ncbi:MAG: paraquat-inducible protein A [Pseudomonadota bacterium]
MSGELDPAQNERPAPGVSRALIAANLSLLIFYPIAWFAPLARAGLLPFFTGNELSIASGIADLWETDVYLAAIVAVFAVVAPYLKTILLAAIQTGLVGGPTWISVVSIAGKLSMADVFLLALYIVLIKGVGVGYVETAWGLYLFTACVLGSIAVAMMTERRLKAPVVEGTR